VNPEAPLPLRLLHLEDNRADAELIQAHIRTEWPDCQITLAATREEFLEALHAEQFDVILSDYSLPSFNGLEALSLAREHCSATPFLFLSGTIGEDNAVTALQRGAADYLIKDRPARLIPALRAALEQRREHLLRRQAEQRLREQAGVLDKARDAICIAELDGNLTYWNPSAAEMFGAPGKPAGGQRLQTMFGLFNQSFIPAALHEIQAKDTWTKEMQVTGPAQELRHIISRWTLVRDDAGHPKSILLINTDVTEQKKLEAQLLRAQRLESIGTLAGGIAHDLNNVLAPVLMSVTLLQQKLTDESLLRLVGILEKSAQHGAGLIRQVLAFARGAGGERAEIQPRLVIKDVVLLLSETLPRAINIIMDLDDQLSLIRANSVQLSQVLMNLGVNARDAMPQGGQLVFKARNVVVDEHAVQANPGATSGPHVLIAVLDSGTGIPPELLDRIFDPFFTTKLAGKGTGLGLSTVLGIVKGHGGFLEVQSEPGQGTEFRLYFPAVAEEAANVSGPQAGVPPPGQGETILVIDDEADVREVLAAVLRKFGYRVLVAESGDAGVELCRQHREDVRVVVTDMMMPGMQGAEVIRQVRTTTPGVGIVAMSGMMEVQQEISEEAGRFVFLAKPMRGEDVVAAVQSVLRDVPA
jgi:PAS domain S-box-containing protein